MAKDKIKSGSDAGYEFLLSSDIDNSNPAVQAEQLNWLHYIMNIGTITGGSEDETLMVFVSMPWIMSMLTFSKLLQIISKLNMVLIKVKIKPLNTCLSWKHGLTTMPITMKTLKACPIAEWTDPIALSLVYSLLRPIGNRSGVEPLISNSLNDRSESGKNSKRMANYSFVRAHDSEVQSIIGQIIKMKSTLNQQGIPHA